MAENVLYLNNANINRHNRVVFLFIADVPQFPLSGKHHPTHITAPSVSH